MIRSIDDFVVQIEPVSIRTLQKKSDREFIKKYFDENSRLPANLLHAILCYVYENENCAETEIIKKLKTLFVIASPQIFIEKVQIIHDLTESISEGLVLRSNENTYSITPKGMQLIKASFGQIRFIDKIISKFLTRNAVLLISSLFLVILSVSKILIGFQMESSALQAEGFENLTDLIKLIVIYFALRYDKERWACLFIISMMIFTGISIFYNSILHIQNPVPVQPSIQAFIVAFLSIGLNSILMIYKGFIGRLKRSEALLSDSLDSKMNIFLSLSLVINLIFAARKIFILDSVLGLLIAGLILKEGIEELYLIFNSGNEIDLEHIRVSSDHMIEHRTAKFLLYQMNEMIESQEESEFILKNKSKDQYISKTLLLERYLEGLSLSRRYFLIFADFSISEMEEKVFQKGLNYLIDHKYIIFDEKSDSYRFTKDSARELERIAQEQRKNLRKHRNKGEKSSLLKKLYVISIWILIVLFLLNIERINSYLFSID